MSPLTPDQYEQLISDLSDRIVELSQSVAQLSDILNQKLNAIENRVKTEEALNIAQQAEIKASRRALSISGGILAIGLLLGSGVIQGADNRMLLERVAVGFILGGAFGIPASELVNKK
jgi:uncharacterized coiled-coil protein SlyX